MTHPDSDVAEVTDAPVSLHGQDAEDAFEALLSQDDDVTEGDDDVSDEDIDNEQDESDKDEGDDDDGQEEPDQQAISPPSSFTKEEKEAFAELPVELQKSFAAIEQRRNADVTQAQQQSAEAQRNAKANAAQVQAEIHSAFSTELVNMVAELMPQMPPAELFRRDEATYREMEEAHRIALSEAGPFVELAQKVQAQATAARNEWLEQQRRIVSEIPGMRDPVKSQEIIMGMSETARELEIAPDTLEGLSADAFKAILTARKWKSDLDAANAKLAQYEQRKMDRVRSFKGKPMTSKPGTAQSSDSRATGNKNAAITQLSSRPHDRDAGEAAFAALGF
jgi:hypothetical protein